jgi:hypothetical protein
VNEATLAQVGQRIKAPIQPGQSWRADRVCEPAAEWGVDGARQGWLVGFWREVDRIVGCSWAVIRLMRSWNLKLEERSMFRDDV